MARDDKTRTPGGGWPQVQWAEGTAATPDEVTDGAPDESTVPVAPQDGLVQPDGYIYDAEGYAHPVYGGFVYDADGNAYPIESLLPQPALPPDASATEPGTGDVPARFEEPRPEWGFGDGASAGGGRLASRQEVKERRRRRSTIALVVSFALVLGAGWFVYNHVLPMFESEPTEVEVAADDFPGPGSGSVEIVVEPGDVGAAIGKSLEDAGVVASAAAFTRAYAANPESTGIQHGTYSMLLEMNAADAVERLLDRANRVELRVTIPEGYTVEQILRVASARTQIPLEDFEAAAEKPRDRGVPKGNKKQLEGWLFPATYTVEPGDTAEDILDAMVAKTISELERLDVADDDWEDVLNKASLVEREVNRDADRGKAARAIENRLEKGMTLGIDATVAYGLGKSGLELTTEDLQSDHPYNTRTQPGLPPTPIGSPGIASIEAVIDPPEGNWEYWVTINLLSGETVFAETYAEHLENVALLDAWIEENGMPDSSRPDDAEE